MVASRLLGSLVSLVAAKTEPVGRTRKNQQYESLVRSCVQTQHKADFQSRAQHAKLMLVAVHELQARQNRGEVRRQQRGMLMTCWQVSNDDGEGVGRHQAVPVLLAAGSQVLQGLA